VPVSAIPTAQPVITPSMPSSCSWLRFSSAMTSTPSEGLHSVGRSAGATMRVAPRASQTSATTSATLARRTWWTVAL